MTNLERLSECEDRVVSEALEQLEREVKKLSNLDAGKIQAATIEKAVKLCHQVRSLIGAPLRK